MDSPATRPAPWPVIAPLAAAFTSALAGGLVFAAATAPLAAGPLLAALAGGAATGAAVWPAGRWLGRARAAERRLDLEAERALNALDEQGAYFMNLVEDVARQLPDAVAGKEPELGADLDPYWAELLRSVYAAAADAHTDRAGAERAEAADALAALRRLIPEALAGRDVDTTGLPRPHAELVREAREAADAARRERAEFQRTLEIVVVAMAQRTQAGALRVQAAVDQLAERLQERPDAVEECMRVDHQAAQLARVAQSVVVLGGGRAGQNWPEPLALHDVLLAAAGRITAYRRVEVLGDHDVAARPQIVEPLIHMLAELLANAAQSSPQTAKVQAEIKPVASGCAIQIDDTGMGMDDHALTVFRAVAAGKSPASLTTLGEVPRLGLAVVGTFARRHGLRVTLETSPYGGVRAVVLIPDDLMTRVAPAGAGAAAVPADRPAWSGPEQGRIAGHTAGGLPMRRRHRPGAAEGARAPEADASGAWMDAFITGGRAATENGDTDG